MRERDQIFQCKIKMSEERQRRHVEGSYERNSSVFISYIKSTDLPVKSIDVSLYLL